MEKVIFDTNFLLEKRMKNFFGKQDQLTKFSKVSEIIIPNMVMGELKARYKRDFKKEKEKFFNTLLTNILNHDADDINIDNSIQQLIESETINFEVIDLKNPEYLFQIKELALTKEPPFVPQDGSDKGFKDAYIYFTVLEYFQEIDDKYIFFVTDDDLLKQAFSNNPNVYVIKDYDAFVRQSVSGFYDQYFIDKLNEFILDLGTLPIRSTVKKENIIDYSTNEDENQLITINIDEKNYLVEIDSGEILSCDFEDLK